MIEIDHTALSKSDQPPLEPAKPILASQLLELEKKQRKRFTEQGKIERISTGCGEIDEILGGGCERGIVVGISAEGGEGQLVREFPFSSFGLFGERHPRK
jgi:predicted ATP-dependent serine protease